MTSKVALLGGGNMPAIHLAHAVGGDLMKGFIAAVAFATILAVVSGLTLSGASAVSHDLYASVFKHGAAPEGSEVRVSRITTVILGIVAIVLGVLFQKVNVAFMVGLAFAVAASANFPVLLLAIMWKGLTTRGAVIGGFVGLISSLALTIVSPGVWEAVLGYPKGSALFPYVSPAIFTIPLSFLCCWLFSVTDSSKAATTRAGGVRRAICALADGDRRRRRRRPLAGRRETCEAPDSFRRPPCPSGLPENVSSWPAEDAVSATRRQKRRAAPFGTTLPLSRHAKLVGALEFLPSESYARNSFAGAITQASSITRGVRQ